MEKKTRTVVYDHELQIEACRFTRIVQPFPNHFHPYYVIGLVEEGVRHLSCKHQKYSIGKGSILVFNPGDNHACVQSNGSTLDYRSLHIKKEVMLDLTEEVSGVREFPRFSKNVIYNAEIACYLLPLHDMIMNGDGAFEKEEQLLLLLSLLIQNYSQPFMDCIPEYRDEIEKTCTFMERRYEERICLEQLCHCAGLSSKSTLLRAFTKSKGVTPYRYLEAIRINEAKKLLEQGASPVEAAMRTGFSDQSHFTNYFRRFIGLAPGMYRKIFLKKEKRGEISHET